MRKFVLAIGLSVAGYSASLASGLPNVAVTPGAIDARVTSANLSSTVCKPGYTRTVRPSESYTHRLKVFQLAHGYAVHADQHLSDYEEDHLIALEIGGSPSSSTNLWPEPRFGTWNAAKKDILENRLHALVCRGQITLNRAQRAMATNWVLAYQQYVR